LGKYDISTIAEKLKTVSIFTDFRDEEIFQLIKGGSVFIYRKDTAICVEGENSRGLFVILKGRVSIFKNQNQSSSLARLATLEENHVFGELSLIDNSPRSTTVISETDTEIFEIMGDVFDKFIAQGSQDLELRFYKKTASYLSERLRKTNEDYLNAQGLLWKYALSPEKTKNI